MPIALQNVVQLKPWGVIVLTASRVQERIQIGGEWLYLLQETRMISTPEVV